MSQSLLHKIDKRLAVLEALTKEHTKQSAAQFDILEMELKRMNTEVGRIKAKVAGIAAITSLIAGGVLKWLL